MMLRMFPRRPKLPQINISTPRIQNLREDVRYSIWRIFSANFFAYNLAESKYFFYSLPNTISTGDLVEFLCRHFPDYVETLPVFYIILWLLGLSGSFLDYSNIFQIFRTPSGQARKNLHINTLVFLTHQIRNIKDMKVPPSVQEVMVCWGLTQRESDKTKRWLHYLKFSIKIKMPLHQIKCSIFLTDYADLKQWINNAPIFLPKIHWLKCL